MCLQNKSKYTTNHSLQFFFSIKSITRIAISKLRRTFILFSSQSPLDAKNVLIFKDYKEPCCMTFQVIIFHALYMSFQVEILLSHFFIVHLSTSH